VMIRTNSATELCITKGQEGTIYTWSTSMGTYEKPSLDVIFVQLINPLLNVQVDELPLNVVPVIHMSKMVICTLPDDTTVKVSHTQVEITPNFAMTDFASQGKMQLYNPINLNNCRTHQSYYTSLSHAATADKLEMLDDITQQLYNGTLPITVFGKTRYSLIQSYFTHVSLQYSPPNMNSVLMWSAVQPFDMMDAIT
ncbi:hypothetical protein IW262DRAFT_1228121, partial [Armillaria fumosa]